MRVTCDLCQKEIDANHVDLEKGIAKCTECNNVFDCRPQLKNVANTPRQKIDLPRSIKLLRTDDGLTIEIRWLSSQLLYLTPFCLAWDVLPLMWYLNPSIWEKSPLMVIYFAVHLAVGIGLTYYCIAGFLNQTIVTISDSKLKVVDTPLTFLRNKEISHADLDQLYAKEKVHRGKKLSWSSYEVHAITKQGKVFPLIVGLNTGEQVLYIEQVLENHLNIQDRPVEGELPRESSPPGHK